MTDDRPNIVLINCDDLGYGDLGCYGSPVNQTPAIDKMADEGVRFTDFYMASPVCSASRAAMLTGCYPTRVSFGGSASGGLGGVLFPGWGVGLHPDEVTIATLLQREGYATKLIGKWHCGDQPDFLPTNHGFDSYYGIPYSNDMGRQVENSDLTEADLEKLLVDIGCTEPFLRPPLPLLLDEEVIEAQPDQAALTERYLEHAVRFIRDNRDTSFFLYLAHMYVHLPIYVQERFKAASANGDYGAAVACVDWATDVILAELARLGLDDNTLVIFTSDNGALAVERGGSGSNLPLRESKGTTWDGGQRVPCIMRWPRRIAAGQTCADMVTALDFLPTIAGWVGAEAPTDRVIDGAVIDAHVGLDGPAPDPDRAFFFIGGPSIEAVRVGRWKLHVNKRGVEMCELYDLSVDIGETTDRSADHPDVVADLTSRIEAARLDLGDERLGIDGTGVRPIGRVDNPVTLTEFDPDHPYFMAEYDLADRG
ncbi:MAG: sulfatase family protein [Acidimicrobiales bacterium]